MKFGITRICLIPWFLRSVDCRFSIRNDEKRNTQWFCISFCEIRCVGGKLLFYLSIYLSLSLSVCVCMCVFVFCHLSSLMLLLQRILLKNGQSLDNRVLRVEKKRSADSDTQRASGLTQPAAGSEQAPTAALSCADTKSTELASAGSSDSSDDELDAAALAAAAKPMKAAGASARSASNAQPPAAAQAARNSNKLKEGPASPPTVTGAKAKAKNMKSQASAPAASKPEAKSKASKSKAAPSVAGQVNVRVKKSKSAPIAAPTVASDSESEFEQEK